MDAFSSIGTILASVVTLICIAQSHILLSKVPQSVPWAGVRQEILSKLRACLREITPRSRTSKAGYEKFGRKGMPYIFPDPGLRPLVMVPQEHVGWMCDQSDSVLSARKPQVGRFAIDYLVPGLDFNHDAFMMGAIRKDVTRNLGKVQPAMIEDICRAIDKGLGLETESWNEVCIKVAMENVFFRSISRVLVGSSLCRNEEYLHYSIGFATWLGAAVILVGQYTPKILKPIFGSIGAVPLYYRKRKALSFLQPVVRDRVANLKLKRADPSFDFEEPKDLITWMSQAMLDNETNDDPAEFLAKRLLFLTLGGLHTTVMTATNILLDLTSSNPDSKFWEQLREEAAGVFKTENDWNNPASLQELPLADSAIRETLRQSPVLTRILLREVLPKDGVTLPSGHHIPRGSWLATDTVEIHNDDRFYLQPNEFDPFRFTKQHQDKIASSGKENLTDKASIFRKTQSLATASDIYLAFGYGKHACPGRWLVAHQLKLMLAYVALNYDIQHIGKRPLNFVFGDSLIPSPTTTMKVRRRKHV